MGFWSAVNSAFAERWGYIVGSEGTGTIGPENAVGNAQHKLKISIGAKTIVFSKNDVRRVDLLFSNANWVRYLILLKNGKKYAATFFSYTEETKGKSKSTVTGRESKAKTAVEFSKGLLCFEWWLFDLIYSEENLASPNTQVLYQSAAPEGNALQAVATPSVQVASNPVKQNVQSGKSAVSQNVQTRTGETLTAQVVVWQDEHNIGRWNCPNCGYVNISSDRTCNKCGLQRVSK